MLDLAWIIDDLDVDEIDDLCTYVNVIVERM